METQVTLQVSDRARIHTQSGSTVHTLNHGAKLLWVAQKVPRSYLWAEPSGPGTSGRTMAETTI